MTTPCLMPCFSTPGPVSLHVTGSSSFLPRNVRPSSLFSTHLRPTPTSDPGPGPGSRLVPCTPVSPGSLLGPFLPSPGRLRPESVSGEEGVVLCPRFGWGLGSVLGDGPGPPPPVGSIVLLRLARFRHPGLPRLRHTTENLNNPETVSSSGTTPPDRPRLPTSGLTVQHSKPERGLP